MVEIFSIHEGKREGAIDNAVENRVYFLPRNIPRTHLQRSTKRGQRGATLNTLNPIRTLTVLRRFCARGKIKCVRCKNGEIKIVRPESNPASHKANTLIHGAVSIGAIVTKSPRLRARYDR